MKRDRCARARSLAHSPRDLEVSGSRVEFPDDSRTSRAHYLMRAARFRWESMNRAQSDRILAPRKENPKWQRIRGSRDVFGAAQSSFPSSGSERVIISDLLDSFKNEQLQRRVRSSPTRTFPAECGVFSHDDANHRGAWLRCGSRRSRWSNARRTCFSLIPRS